jgi:glycosyltransferase involved in cell wall biosynthesis
MSNCITIIIPSIGRKKLLKRALESLERQTLLPEKIIIINSGGVDICKGNIPKSLRVMTEICNIDTKINVSKARNLGASKACTNFIGFLDDDDEWSNTVVSSFKCHKVPLNGFVYFPIIYKSENGFYTRVRHAMFSNVEEFKRRFLYSNPGIGGSNIIMRKSQFTRLKGFDEKLNTAEDRDIVFRLIGGKIFPILLDNCFTICNTQLQSLSRTNIARGQFNFYMKHKYFYTKYDKLKVVLYVIKIYVIQFLRYKKMKK